MFEILRKEAERQGYKFTAWDYEQINRRGVKRAIELYFGDSVN